MKFDVRIEENASQGVKDLLLVRGVVGFAIASVALSECIKDHFVARERLPNSKNWPKTHFFDRARQQTHHSHTPDSATVAISLIGFGTFFSGQPNVIRPVKAQMLTIPARPEAYGRRAREFSDLVFRFVDNGRGQMVPALVRAEQTTFAFGRKRKDGTRKAKGMQEVGGEVYYWLAHQVRTKPHPEALPTTGEMQQRITGELESYVANL